MQDQNRAERFVNLMDRIRRLAAEENPLQHAEISVSMPQLTMLEWVSAHPGCHLKDMAAGLRVTMPTVSVGVRRIEQAGLLTRLSDTRDGRAIRLELTPVGRQLVNQASHFKQEKMNSLLISLSSLEQETLLRLMEKSVISVETRQGSSVFEESEQEEKS
jgi:DNA-binding MarR family transcriptional regulator